MSLSIKTVTYFKNKGTLEVEGVEFFRVTTKTLSFFSIVVSNQIYDIFLDLDNLKYTVIPLNTRTLKLNEEEKQEGILWVSE